MTRETAGIGLVLVAVAVESFAQLFLKRGAMATTEGGAPPAGGMRASPAATTVDPAPGRMPLRPFFPAGKWLSRGSARFWILLGVAAYGLEIALYTVALHHLDIGVAFPLGSLCFVGVALLSKLLLGEMLGGIRWLGIGFIIAGAILVTR